MRKGVFYWNHFIYVIIIYDFFEIISENSFHITSDAILVVLIILMTYQKTIKIGEIFLKKLYDSNLSNKIVGLNSSRKNKFTCRFFLNK